MARLLPLLCLCAGACLGEATTAPMEWTPVQTDAIARWKAENKAPDGVVASASERSVRFLVEATGCAASSTVEFAAIGPLSDRAYESLFVTVASPAALAAAFDRAGVPRGRPADVSRARLWPEGEKVALSVRSWGSDTLAPTNLAAVLKDLRPEEGPALGIPAAWTAGARDASGAPVASTNIPCAVFALYNHAPSLLQLDGLFDQSSTYGRFQAARTFRPGELFELTATWDGRTRVKDVVARISATNAVETMKALQTTAKDHEVHAALAFDGTVSVAQAAQVAGAFALLDGPSLRMNGAADGQFFFRAFLPETSWRQREGRIFQPFEVHVAADGAKTFVFCEEDWSGEGVDPVLKPKSTPFSDWAELPGLISKTGEQGEKVNVMFLFAPKSCPVSTLTPVLAATAGRIGTFYVFGD
ncbi:MAG: hypothetical protein PUE68_07155 [Kiritimatiellae bacterium]|nr:hypothetical protein [Kiritimatiellia bacterium]